ncbi:MAG TPA: toll/interleukin-1 receptor domain-containing protein [Chitinophagaceae bacterium]|nr:toll/interleukin-1 receptor domain-containing protein [Chitinophagaceae bacterium]
MIEDGTSKLRLFISYSHEDEKMKNDLDKHLVMLKRSGKIEVWNDRKLIAGQEWDSEIKKEMQDAHIILLLISADFNNSEYIWKEELAHAMQRHEQGTAKVVPVILRKCEWNEMPYAKLQALPRGARPVSDFQDKDDAFTDIASGIRLLINTLLLKK